MDPEEPAVIPGFYRRTKKDSKDLETVVNLDMAEDNEEEEEEADSDSDKKNVSDESASELAPMAR
jgi:hypothetical protein